MSMSDVEYEIVLERQEAAVKQGLIDFLNVRESSTADMVLACEQFGCTPADFYPDDPDAAAALASQIGFGQITALVDSAEDGAVL